MSVDSKYNIHGFAPWSYDWVNQVINDELWTAFKLCKDGVEFKLCGNDIQSKDFVAPPYKWGGIQVDGFDFDLFRKHCFNLLYKDALPILSKIAEAYRRGATVVVCSFRDFSKPLGRDVELLEKLFKGCGIHMQKYEYTKDLSTDKYQFSWNKDNGFLKEWVPQFLLNIMARKHAEKMARMHPLVFS